MTSKLQAIADNADVIVNGYAFTKSNDRISVLNLNKPDRAAVLRPSGVLETSRDDIELSIVTEYLQRNLKYMEA